MFSEAISKQTAQNLGLLGRFKNTKIDRVSDIAAMKVAAISERGTKRDFIDLYFILQKISFQDALDLYDRKYKKLASNLIHIKKSLVYFDDSENDPMPKMITPVDWGEVKSFFEKEVKK